MKKLISLLAFSAFLAGPVTAQDTLPASSIFKSSQQVFDACTSSVAADVSACEWYLMAAYDMALYFQDTDQVDDRFCLPDGTTAPRLRELVVKYWTARPGVLNSSAVSTIWNAIEEAHPGACKA